MKKLRTYLFAVLFLGLIILTGCSKTEGPAAPQGAENYEGIHSLQKSGNCVTPPSGLISWWPGDGDANDIVDNNHGTLQNGATFASGMVDQAFSFDGVDDYVQVGPQASLVNTGTLSIDVWIFPTGPGSDPTNGGVIVNKEGEYEIHRFADGTIRPAFASASWTSINTGFVAPLNQWTHIAVVDDNGTIRTYANGVLVNTFSTGINVGDFHPEWNDFRIGGRQCTHCSEYFQGLIDEVEVFNRALTADEIASIYNAGSAGKCKKVTICHKPGTPAQKTLVIPIQALAGHLGHGDTIGPCQ